MEVLFHIYISDNNGGSVRVFDLYLIMEVLLVFFYIFPIMEVPFLSEAVPPLKIRFHMIFDMICIQRCHLFKTI